MTNNMDCSHSAWPLGTSTLPGFSVAKSAWGKKFPRILRAKVVSVHPLKHLYGLYPYAAWRFQEKGSNSPITSQTSSPAAHVPADTGELWVPARRPSPVARDLWTLLNGGQIHQEEQGL